MKPETNIPDLGFAGGLALTLVITLQLNGIVMTDQQFYGLIAGLGGMFTGCVKLARWLWGPKPMEPEPEFFRPQGPGVEPEPREDI